MRIVGFEFIKNNKIRYTNFKILLNFQWIKFVFISNFNGLNIFYKKYVFMFSMDKIRFYINVIGLKSFATIWIVPTGLLHTAKKRATQSRQTSE